MTTAEILAATAWLKANRRNLLMRVMPLGGGEGMAIADACEGYAAHVSERDQRIIKALSAACEAVMRFCPSYPGEVEVALKLAKEAQGE